MLVLPTCKVGKVYVRFGFMLIFYSDVGTHLCVCNMIPPGKTVFHSDVILSGICVDGREFVWTFHGRVTEICFMLSLHSFLGVSKRENVTLRSIQIGLEKIQETFFSLTFIITIYLNPFQQHPRMPYDIAMMRTQKTKVQFNFENLVFFHVSNQFRGSMLHPRICSFCSRSENFLTPFPLPQVFFHKLRRNF